MAVSPVNSVSTLPAPVAAAADDIPF